MSEPRTFLDGRVALYIGDCREVLKTLADCSIDSVVTDPPYHLQSIVKRFGGANAAPAKFGIDGAFARASSGFMGKRWDGGDVARDVALWSDALRILKPGGHMCVFGGTRTAHRMVCAIEDAGFEIRDSIAWVYATGFPKSHSINKALNGKICDCERAKTIPERDLRSMCVPDVSETVHRSQTAEQSAQQSIIVAGQQEPQERGTWHHCQRCGKPMVPNELGTALKPAYETICLARKPLSEATVAANVLRWGTGAINVGACRVQIEDNEPYDLNGKVSPNGGGKTGIHGGGCVPQANWKPNDGRWPANLIHDGSDEVLECFPETSSGFLNPEHQARAGYSSESPCHHGGSTRGCAGTYEASSGSAARFFYTPKADADDRLGSKHPTGKPLGFGDGKPAGIGATGLKKRSKTHEHGVGDSGSQARYFAAFPQDANRIWYGSKAGSDDRLGSKHPTVKPLDLIQYLVRLITPPGGTCLDPFAGTGTTAEACFREGFRAILIEREAEYIADIERRMSLVMAGPDERAHAGMKARGRPRDDGPLFGNDHKVR